MTEYIIGGSVVVINIAILGLVLRENHNFRKEAESKFTNKDVCKIIHEGVSSDLKEIKGDMKEVKNYLIKKAGSIQGG